ncbi:MAG: DUF2442 domain-containing protein [Alcaligenaceae bacterium]|nr:DUF2442 domain-containing protein [Alcaligenaceae bacterium]
MSEHFFPQLLKVEALAPYRLRTIWNTGEVLEVDVGPVLRSHPSLAPILNEATFSRAHLSEWGRAVEWFDAEFGQDNVYAWAKEQSGQASHEMFDSWIHRNKLSLTKAAEALGISRRMASYYRTANKPIPRTIWLACLGWEATRPEPGALPRSLVSSSSK